jgi:hypothetical protein
MIPLALLEMIAFWVSKAVNYEKLALVDIS